jgi:hypothetical protein
VGADHFNVGTIAAMSSVILIPGISSDGSPHSGFWHVTGVLLDTSETGPNGNDTQFSFTGLQGALTVSSGVFTPASSVQAQSNDRGLRWTPCLVATAAEDRLSFRRRNPHTSFAAASDCGNNSIYEYTLTSSTAQVLAHVGFAVVSVVGAQIAELSSVVQKMAVVIQKIAIACALIVQV